MSTLTPALIATLAQSVAHGCSAPQAAVANGVSRGTFYDWLSLAEHGFYHSPHSQELLELTRQLAVALEQARASRYQVLVGNLYHNATTPNPKTGWYDTQAADKLLSKSADTREDWQEQRSLTVDSRSLVLTEHRIVREIAATGGLPALEDARARLLQEHPELSPDHAQQ